MSHPSVSPRTYVMVFAALIVLTLTTVWVAHYDLGPWHNPVGLGIAVVKGALIVLFFMHIIHSSRITWIFAVSGAVWLALLIAGTMNDVVSRPWPTNPTGSIPSNTKPTD